MFYKFLGWAGVTLIIKRKPINITCILITSQIPKFSCANFFRHRQHFKNIPKLLKLKNIILKHVGSLRSGKYSRPRVPSSAVCGPLMQTSQNPSKALPRGARVTAFHRGGLRSWCQGLRMRNKGLLSSTQAPKDLSRGGGAGGTPGQRAQDAPSVHLPQTPASNPNSSVPLAAWQEGGEMGIKVPSLWGQGMEPGSALPAGCP